MERSNQLRRRIDEAIEEQKGSADEERPGTGLNPETGNEESRTGKRTSRRDIRPGARPESSGERSQNASGGKSNR